MKSWSVVIIGGGPAGSVAAMALLKRGIKDILVLESGEYDKFVIGESIPPEIKPLFNYLGIYNDFLKEGHLPCFGTCSYWGDYRKGYNDSLLSPHGHGWHLDRRKFNLFLANQARLMGAVIHTNSTFTSSAQLENGQWQVKYRIGAAEEDILAKLVIDATGQKVVFAEKQLSRAQHGEPLICLARRFKIKPGTNISTLTHIEAIPNGWWYAAKLPNNELLAALYTDRETQKQANLQYPKPWMEALHKTKTIKELVQNSLAKNKNIKGFYAYSYCLDKITGKNWLAIGDAASAYDPLIAKGIYKSISEAIKAAEAIDDLFNGKTDSLLGFEHFVKGNYRNYKEERNYYYNLEQRWNDQPFWEKFQTDKIQSPAEIQFGYTEK